MKFQSWKSVVIASVGIISITILELYAISQGINGIALTFVVGGIVAVATGGAIKLWRK